MDEIFAKKPPNFVNINFTKDPLKFNEIDMVFPINLGAFPTPARWPHHPEFLDRRIGRSDG